MNAPTLNPRLCAVAAPPIARAGRWIASYDGRHGPLIDCSQAVPNHAPPEAFATRLAQAAASPAAARYGDILGDNPLRETYAAHVSTLYGAAIAPGRIAITSGCNQAFFVAMMTVAGAGDTVILPSPAYFNHTMTLDMLGIEARALPTKAADGFLPDPAAVEALIDAKCRALVLVSPNNPTGAIYPPALIAELFDICVTRGLVLVIDETYRDFLPAASGPPHAVFGRSETREHLIGLYSFSKAYAIPGHRMGAMIAGEPMIAEIEKVIDCLQICAPRPAQAALPWAIAALANWREANRVMIAARAKLFADLFAALPGWSVDQIGAYFAYVRHPFASRPSETVAAQMTRDLGILTLPGSFFGPDGEDHLRIAFANVDEAGLCEIARRLSLSHSVILEDHTENATRHEHA